MFSATLEKHLFLTIRYSAIVHTAIAKKWKLSSYEGLMLIAIGLVKWMHKNSNNNNNSDIATNTNNTTRTIAQTQNWSEIFIGRMPLNTPKW